jgi:WD40 repeat protein
MYAPEGQKLAIVGTHNKRLIKVWNIIPGQSIKLGDFISEEERYQGIITLLGHEDDINSVVFSPDGHVIATGSVDKTIKLWDAETGSELKTLAGHTEEVNSVAFSPDGKLLASAGGGDWVNLQGERDFKIRLWEAESGRLLNTLGGHSEPVLRVAFSADGRTIASVTDQGVALWDVRGGIRLTNFPGVAEAKFSPDGRTVALSSTDESAELHYPVGNNGTVKLWDVVVGKVRMTLSNISARPSATFSPDGRTLAAFRNEWIQLWDIQTGAERKRLTSQHGGANRSIAFAPDGRTLAAVSQGSSVILWDIPSGNELVRLLPAVRDDDANWTVITPDQRFDTNFMEYNGMQWLFRDELSVILPLEVFSRQYFEPDLFRKALDHERLPPLRPIWDLNRVQPNVGNIQISAIADNRTVTVSVDVENVRADIIRRGVKETLSSGVYDLRLFRDGQMVGQSTPHELLEKYASIASRNAEAVRPRRPTDSAEDEAWRAAHDLSRIVKFERGKATYTFKNVRLPRDGRRQVEFTAYAFNADRVKSQTAYNDYYIRGDVPRGPRRAYVIAFGANQYESPDWDLQFAANDANAMAEIVSATLRRGKEFDEVVAIPLISDDVRADGATSARRGATKGNVQTVLELLAGKAPAEGKLKSIENAIGAETLKKIRQATPDDLVLISFSAHGYADRQGIFYIVPTDIGVESKRVAAARFTTRFISSDELSLWLRDVDAGEMVMIVDACYAAAAVEREGFKPAPMGSRGLGQLAFDKGMKILTATQAADLAIETGGSIRHGLLTYALLREGLEKRKADFRVKDQEIRLKEWLEFGEFRVPGLHEDIAKGNLKSIGGHQVKAAGAGAIQQPSLFYFTRKKTELTLMSLK